MKPVFDDMLKHLRANDARPPGTARIGDIVVLLTAALGPAWNVQREIDCVGEVSIVVMPVSNHPAVPTFILYEAGGQAHVGTIRQDEWEADQGFDTVQQAAIAGIIAAANPTCGNGGVSGWPGDTETAAEIVPESHAMFRAGLGKVEQGVATIAPGVAAGAAADLAAGDLAADVANLSKGSNSAGLSQAS